MHSYVIHVVTQYISHYKERKTAKNISDQKKEKKKGRKNQANISVLINSSEKKIIQTANNQKIE